MTVDYPGHARPNEHPPVHGGARTRQLQDAARETFGLEPGEPWVVGIRYAWVWSEHAEAWQFALHVFDHLTGEIVYESVMTDPMARDHVNAANDLYYGGAIATPGAPPPPPPPRPRWEPPRPRQEPPRP